MCLLILTCEQVGTVGPQRGVPVQWQVLGRVVDIMWWLNVEQVGTVGPQRGVPVQWQVLGRVVDIM